MNCWAAAVGADRTPATATAAAINFAIIRIILPRYGREVERANAPGQPTHGPKSRLPTLLHLSRPRGRHPASHWRQGAPPRNLGPAKSAHQRSVLSGRTSQCLPIAPLDYVLELSW